MACVPARLRAAPAAAKFFDPAADWAPEGDFASCAEVDALDFAVQLAGRPGEPAVLERVAASMRMRSVVFDIGWVFVALRPEPLLRLLGERGFRPEGLDHVVRSIGLVEHESGRIDGEELLRRLAALAPDPPRAPRFTPPGSTCSSCSRGMLALAGRLAQDHRVYLPSNVGDLHWAHLRRVFGLHRIAHDALPSFEAGVMKPEPLIYELAERRFGLDPATTVFIDDREENSSPAPARAAGTAWCMPTTRPWRSSRHSACARAEDRPCPSP
ncbi:MAG: HAD-IA family hydrolase [Steroidobacteraceae bacterium]